MIDRTETYVKVGRAMGKTKVIEIPQNHSPQYPCVNIIPVDKPSEVAGKVTREGTLRGCGKMSCNPKSHNPKTCQQESHKCGYIRLCPECQAGKELSK